MRGRAADEREKVGALLVIIVDATPQAVAQQVKVYAHVDGAGLLPAYVLVGRSYHHAGGAERAGEILGCHVGCGVAAYVTADTVGCAEL